uniref:Uncharacterized protein n=1 Tax=Ascaris lumbricoides TaxID=6252 RepID=A0A9J2PCJ3_ASCLU
MPTRPQDQITQPLNDEWDLFMKRDVVFTQAAWQTYLQLRGRPLGSTHKTLQVDKELREQKLLIDEEVRLIEGDAIVVDFKVLRPTKEERERGVLGIPAVAKPLLNRDTDSFRISLILDDTIARAFHMEISSELSSMSGRSQDHGWETIWDYYNKLHDRGDHWCSIHIRVLENKYQVFYDGLFLREFRGVRGVFRNFMKYTYVRGIVVNAYNSDQFLVAPADGGVHGYFVNYKHRISFGRVQQALHAGEELFIEAFIGNISLYYWNEHKKQDRAASITLLHSNSFPVLRIDLVKEKDISTGKTSCAVIHHHDPNDIAAFEISGNIEPVRYAVFDIGSS